MYHFQDVNDHLILGKVCEFRKQWEAGHTGYT